MSTKHNSIIKIMVTEWRLSKQPVYCTMRLYSWLVSRYTNYDDLRLFCLRADSVLVDLKEDI